MPTLRPKLLALHVMRWIGVFALARSLTRRHVRVVCWHGGCVGDERLFNPKLFVRRELVEKRLRWMRTKGFTPLPLDKAVRNLREQGSIDSLPVVLTLDDGWFSSRDHVVRPALEAGFPITLYLASQVMQRQHPVLDVTVEYILWKAGPVQAQFHGVHGVADGLYNVGEIKVRKQLSSAMVSGLRSISESAPRVVEQLERFASQLGVHPADLALSSRRFSYLDGFELKALFSEGCDVQLHGHAHIYPRGQPDALRDDLTQCRAAITALGLPNAVHYCYPSGDFDDHAPALLAGLGVASATTCVPGLIRPGKSTHPYLMPRFLDGEDVSQIEFEAEMCGVLEFARRLRKGSRRLVAKTQA